MSKRRDAKVRGDDQESRLALADTWTPEVSEARAHALGLTLGPRHWQVICAAREEYASGGRAPSMSRVALRSHLALEDLSALFPPAPAEIIARLAGIAGGGGLAPERSARALAR